MAEIFCDVKVDAKAPANIFLRSLDTLKMLENGQRLKLDQGTLGMSDPLQLTFDQLGTDRTS